MTPVRFLTICTCAVVTTNASFALNLRTDVSAAWTENISHASAPSDWRDAMRYDAGGSLSLFREWRAGFMTTGELDAAFEHVPKFSKLDALSGGLTATARQKFGFGAFAPAIAVDLGLHGRDTRLAGDDGWTATAAVGFTKRLTPAWRFSATADWQQHYAESSIFDTRHHRVFATVTWDIHHRLQLSHGNGRLWGDFTAHAGRATWPRALAGEFGENVAAYYNTVPWTVSDSFGPGWVTYRVTGRVNFWWLELSPALGRNTSLPLRYESLVSINKVGVKYRQDVWTLQLVHRF